jgi:predicted transcriptional regulator of viral defense system
VLFLAFIVNTMRYIKFRELFKDFTVFSSADIGSADPTFHRRRLNDWQDKGYVKKIINGYYLFSETPLNENVLFESANRIYQPSYISLEMAFSFYGLIPESVYGITSVSTRATRTFPTPLGTFLYRSLKPRLFFGYNLVEYGAHKHFKIATPEKAILDFLYFNPSLTKAEDIVGLRFNQEAFLQKVKEAVFFEYLDRFGQKTLSKRIEIFWRVMNDA